MSARLRSTMNLAAGAATIGALLLGGVWLSDRAHRWERPAWRHRSFIRLQGEARGEPAAGGRWVMAVNPRCGHCLATLARLHVAWARRGGRPDLITLIVDTPERPGPAALRPIPTTQIWWDAQGIWRRRWGHRLYGEVIQFDGAGRFVRTVLADDIFGRSRPPRSGEPLAPATPQEGGT